VCRGHLLNRDSASIITTRERSKLESSFNTELEISLAYTVVYDRGVQPLWAYGPKAALELKFCDPRKGPDFQASITVFERYCQGWIKGTAGLRLIRYVVRLDTF